MANLVAAGGGVRVQGRQYALQPFIAMGHARHEIPAHGPTAAQLLHQAACKLGRDPGARGQHAMVVETGPMDHHANA
eukprot:6233023-Lingulodinium_polyedra.AAC.1